MERGVVSIERIELSKENILPVRHGRSAAELTKRLGLKGGLSAPNPELEKARKAFEARIQKQADHEDPLSIWLAYYKWAVDNFPNDKNEQLKIMERCTAAFRRDERYQGDIRFLRVWLLYADVCTNAQDVFNYLLNREIGTGWELLYSCHATVLEQLGKYKDAENSYKLGIARSAKPLDKLENNYSRFLVRMEQRVAKAKAAKAERAEAKPARKAAAPAGEPKPKKRRALGTLAGSKTIPLATDLPGNGATTSGLAVADVQPEDEEAGGEVKWEHFPTEAERTKENTQERESWAGKTLPQKRRPKMKPVEEFSVFCEEEEEADKETPAKADAAAEDDSDEAFLEMARRIKERKLAERKAKAAPAKGLRSQPQTRTAAKPTTKKQKTGTTESYAYDISIVKEKCSRGQEVSFEEWRARKYRDLLLRLAREDEEKEQAIAEEAARQAAAEEAARAEAEQAALAAAKAEEERQRNEAAKMEEERLAMEAEAEGQRAQAAEAAAKKEKSKLNLPASYMQKLQAEEGISRLSSSEEEFDANFLAIAEEDSDEERNALGFKMEEQTLMLRGENTMFNVLDETAFLNDTLHQDKHKFELKDDQALTIVSAQVEEDLMAEFCGSLSSGMTDDEANEFSITSLGISPASVAGFEVPADSPVAETAGFEVPADSPDGADFALYTSDGEADNLMPDDSEDIFMIPDDENVPPVDKENAAALPSATPLAARRPALGLRPRNEEIAVFQDEPELPKAEEAAGDFSVFVEEEDEAEVAQVPAEEEEAEPLDELFAAEGPFDPFTTQHDIELLSLLPVQLMLQEADQKGLWRQTTDPSPHFQPSKSLRNATRNFTMTNGTLGDESELSLFETDFPSADDRLANSLIQVGPELGVGGYASVYVAHHVIPSAGLAWTDIDYDDTETLEDHTRALKVQADKISLLWEFHCARVVQARLRETIDGGETLDDLSSVGTFYRTAYMQERFCQSIALCEYADKGFLLMECCDQGTLQDVINAHRVKKATVSEVLVAFFALEMLSSIQVLHTVCNVIHGDLKPDNFLLMNQSSDSEWGEWAMAGGEGWEKRGLKLIDFGRSKDMTLYEQGVEQMFEGDRHNEHFQCLPMREGKPWNFELDLFGVAAILHLLLHKDYMEVTEKDGTYGPKKAFKRYWKFSWAALFGDLINESNPDLGHHIGLLQKFLAKNKRQIKVELGKLNRLMQQ